MNMQQLQQSQNYKILRENEKKKIIDAIINTRSGRLSSGMERKWNSDESIYTGNQYSRREMCLIVGSHSDRNLTVGSLSSRWTGETLGLGRRGPTSPLWVTKHVVLGSGKACACQRSHAKLSFHHFLK